MLNLKHHNIQELQYDILMSAAIKRKPPLKLFFNFNNFQDRNRDLLQLSSLYKSNIDN